MGILLRPKSLNYQFNQARAGQTSTNIAANDHIKFDTVENNLGSDISLDTTTAYVNTANTASIGRFTLTAGRVYKMIGSIVFFSGSVFDVLVDYAWFNSDTTTQLGRRARTMGNQRAVNEGVDGVAMAVLSPTVNTRVELRITSSSAATIGNDPTFLQPWALIESIV